jgi:hypothetical protein
MTELPLPRRGDFSGERQEMSKAGFAASGDVVLVLFHGKMFADLFDI